MISTDLRTATENVRQTEFALRSANNGASPTHHLLLLDCITQAAALRVRLEQIAIAIQEEQNAKAS